MTEIEGPPPRPHTRVRAAAVVLLTLTALLALLVVATSHGLALEYGDTSATDAHNAVRALLDWGVGIVLVAGLAAWTVWAARLSRGRHAIGVTAALTVMLTVVGVPAGAVIGVQQKFARYPDLPMCTQGFRTGPAVPVVRAAQRAFAGLEHPGPFSGGGSSGIDGCSSQVMVPDDFDVRPAYRETLARHGWRTTDDTSRVLEAVKNGQAFEATRNQDGAWWVWIGPAGLEPTPTRPGEVAPRQRP